MRLLVARSPVGHCLSPKPWSPARASSYLASASAGALFVVPFEPGRGAGQMGRFDSLSPEERDLLLRLLIHYLDKTSPGDKRREVGQALLKEISPAGNGMVMQIFATALKKARKRAGYKSAEQFAKKIEMHPAAYRHYERGASQPNLETLARICAELGCTPNDLLTQQ
jgi:DNA-binding XRE family transcriptional regulator